MVREAEEITVGNMTNIKASRFMIWMGCPSVLFKPSAKLIGYFLKAKRSVYARLLKELKAMP